MSKMILFIDDDSDIVEVVKNRLESYRYTVISADNGEDGIMMARQEKPDLIIMDILMPGMTGGEAVKLLQEDHTTQNIPTIFLTSLSSEILYDKEGDKININGRFYTAVAKPFDPKRLMAVINGIIGDA
ncbi:MAG: response regulator [Candidatus Omnitrophica bacterium]|nr:response regulator [Candidatus Omnitrophota bacterium]